MIPDMDNCRIKSKMDGNYEVLVENHYSIGPQTNSQNQMSNLMYSTNMSHISSTPLTIGAHFGKDDHITDQLTPRSGSISETSTSPEKNSDTSSGVHSNSSNGANSTPSPSALIEKRSTSMESVMAQLAQAAEAAKPSFRSLSLQRYMSSLPTDKTNHSIPHRMSSFNENDHNMVIRRAKRPQRTSDIFNTNGTARGNHLRMTSFTETPDYMRFHSMPSQPKMVPIPTVPTTQTLLAKNEYSRQTFNDFKPFIANENLYSHVITGTQKPVVSIAPQMMTINGNPNFLQQNQEQRGASNYSFITSQCNPNAPASGVHMT